MAGVYEITQFRGGISDYEDKGIPGAFKFGSGLDVRKVKDTLSCQQALVDEGLNASGSPSASLSPSHSASASASRSPSPSASFSPSLGSVSKSASRSPSGSASPSGSLSPSTSPSPSPSPSAGLTTVFAGLIYFFVKCSDGNTYGFDNTGRIYRRSSDGNWVQVYKDPEGAIKGAAEWSNDQGQTFLYWATNTALNRKPIPGLSNWNDANGTGSNGSTWPKQNLTSADWHTMREAGGALMIANGPTLAMVGFDDSYTNEALDLIPGNISKTIVERNGRTIVGTFRAADPNKGINAAIDAEVPLAQVGDDGEVFFANMSDSIPVKRFPGGGKVNPGGVANEISEVNFFEWEQTALSWIDKQAVGNLALFGVWGGDVGKNGVYTIGRKFKNAPFIMNLEYALEVDEIGAVINTDGTTLISYKDGTSFGVKAVDPNNKAQGIYEGLDFKAPVKKPVNITQWKTAEVFMAPLPSGASVQFWYKIDKTGSFVQAYLADGNTSYSTANGDTAVFRIAAEGQIYEPRVVLNPVANSSPEVHRMRIYFE